MILKALGGVAIVILVGTLALAIFAEYLHAPRPISEKIK